MIGKNAEYFIQNLNLQIHPEGGYFKEIYRSGAMLQKAALPEGFSGSRNFSTSIYFLLESGQVSHFHRIKSDEIWSFHCGSPLEIHLIDKMDGYQILKLGYHLAENEQPQQIVKAGTWFGASVCKPNTYSLVSCFVSPGFDFADFELADRQQLVSEFPEYKSIIHLLTKE